MKVFCASVRTTSFLPILSLFFYNNLFYMFFLIFALNNSFHFIFESAMNIKKNAYQFLFHSMKSFLFCFKWLIVILYAYVLSNSVIGSKIFFMKSLQLLEVMCICSFHTWFEEACATHIMTRAVFCLLRNQATCELLRK